jgi:sphingomyelin phosphodiesterase
VKEVHDSEQRGEKVWIIAHINPGRCVEKWKHLFYQVVERFSPTIAGMFYGHSHTDGFEVMVDSVSKSPINMAYIVRIIPYPCHVFIHAL